MGLPAAAILAGSVGAIAVSTAVRVRMSGSASVTVVKVQAGVPNIVHQNITNPCVNCKGGAKVMCSRCNGRGAHLHLMVACC